MMSLHVLSAGTGYLYYTQETASGDELRAEGRELGDYYTVEGTPPGQWLGSGVAALDVSGNVTEDQMSNLFGQGMHPDRERIIAEKIAAGYSKKEAERAAKLGRRYYEFSPKDTTLAAAIATREADFKRLKERAPTAVERHKMRATEGATLFRQLHGRNATSKEELGKFITAQMRPQQSAVAGFDLTFTPVKSVSVLWALGDEDTRRMVEKAQDDAIRESIAYLERNGIATRVGTNGIAQVDVKGGLIATSFRHHDSRLGDPNLHHHVVVSNKVQDAQGHWKTIDGKLLHRSAVAVSEHYNTRLQANLEAQGIAFEARTVNGSAQPVMEITAVPTELTRLFSKRSEGIRDSLKELRKEYEIKHGHTPDQAALVKLAQAATLDTRPDKAPAKTLEALAAGWRKEAQGLYSEHHLAAMMATRKTTINGPASSIDVDEAARSIIENVSDKRSTWTAQNVMAEAERWAKEYASEHGALTQEQVDSVVCHALEQDSLRLTPTSVHSDFVALSRNAGHSEFVHRTDTRYTSESILKDENLLLRAGQTNVIPAATMENFERAVIAHGQAVARGDIAHALDAGQLELARQFATSPKMLGLGIGAAGTGKSTAMGLVRAAVTDAGGRVIGLAPSAVAAANLGEQLGITAVTTDKFLLGKPTAPLQVTPGTLVIVDEAGMQGTAKLANVVRVVERGGGLVRFIGDDRQLSAVQAGGALRLLVNELGAAELESIHRFSNPEEAAASLLLRTPSEHEADPFTWYKDNGRVQAGDLETVEGLAFGKWQNRLNAGETAIMMAPSNESARQLSERAQAYRISTGEVHETTDGVELRDGSHAWVGDYIVTRSNNTQLKTKRGREAVNNGDMWEVTETHTDGSLSATHLDHGGQIHLPADYVSEHTHLGYAMTTHRAQGMTRTAGIPILDAATTRANAYVAATRGEDDNALFVVLAPGEDRDSVLAMIASNHGVEESAHEAMATEYERVNAPIVLVDQYRHVNEEANKTRMAAMARAILGEDAEKFITAESWGAVTTNLAKAEHEGWNVETLFTSAHGLRDFETADDNSAVLAWRIEGIVEAAAKKAEEEANKPEGAKSRPLENLSDEALQQLSTTAAEQLHTSRTTLSDAAAIHGPNPADHWTVRRYGNLSDAELEQRISNLRFSSREQASINDAAAERRAQYQLRGVREEHRIRHNHFEAERREAEAMERGSVTRYTGQAPELAGHRERLRHQEVIDAQVRAEQRLRAMTPGPVTAPEAPDSLPEWLAPAKALDSKYLPAQWRDELLARREVLSARFEERGHLLAAEPTQWAQALGPVPERTEVAQQWRDTAAEVEMFRARYQIPDTETTPIPERFREQEIGKELHEKVVTVSKRSRALANPATETDKNLDAINTVGKTAASHTNPSQAQQASDTDRASHGQDATAIAPEKTTKPRLKSRMEKLTAEKNVARQAEQAAQRAAETTQQRAAREQAERTASHARQNRQGHGQEI